MPQYPYNAQNSQLTTNGGTKSHLNLTASTVINTGEGRVFSIAVNTAGTAGTFAVYDVATTGGVAAANLIWEGSATTAAGTVVILNFPYQVGLVVVPPTGGVLAVSYV